MVDPNIKRKETPSKLSAAPSIQRKETPSKLSTAPSIQRQATESRGTPLKGIGYKVDVAPTQRQAVQQTAKEMGIDTKGLSTREVKESISEKRAAQKELSDFIKDTVKGLPQNTGNNTESALDMGSRKTEDRPSNLSSVPSRRPNTSRLTSEIEFYCWKDGEAGTIMIQARDFTPL